MNFDACYHVQVMRPGGWVEMAHGYDREEATNYADQLRRREKDAIVRVRKYSN
ncbi:hypothetical protein SEA_MUFFINTHECAT_2 [Microbacterium phage MuffinTheCat]|nr:hypothetical protein SEA_MUFFINTHECAT_2 [Microbacterium phage MuffinTheCat]